MRRLTAVITGGSVRRRGTPSIVSVYLPTVHACVFLAALETTWFTSAVILPVQTIPSATGASARIMR